MTWTAPGVAREDPPYIADERTSLQSWLDYDGQTLLWKCSGLSGEQLAARPIEQTSLSLLGLVRHMTYVQRVWVRQRFAGMSDLAALYCTEEFPDGDFDLAAPAAAAADFAAYEIDGVTGD